MKVIQVRVGINLSLGVGFFLSVPRFTEFSDNEEKKSTLFYQEETRNVLSLILKSWKDC